MAVFKRFESTKQDSLARTEMEKYPRLSVVGKTLFIKGKIRASEEIVIDGKVEGSINVKHKVIVGKSGVIKADIEASEIIIRGKVDGNVKASSKVEIVPEGILNGNIVSQRVVLAEGAIFKGNIDMSLKEEKKIGQGPLPVKEIKDNKDDVKK